MLSKAWRLIYKTFTNLGLKVKLLIAFLAVSVIPLILIGYFSYKESYNVILQNSRITNIERLSLVNENITSKIKTIDSISLNIVTYSSLMSLLNEKDPVTRGRNVRSVESFLRTIAISNEGISDIIIIDEDHNIYSSGSIGYQPDLRSKYGAYYDQAIKGKGSNVWLDASKYNPSGLSETNSEIFPSVSNIKDFYNDVNRGILIINVKTDFLDEGAKRNYSRQSAGNFILLSDQKTVMLNIKSLDSGISDDLFKGIEGSEGVYIQNVNNKQYFITYLKNEKTGWYLVNLVPVSELVSSTQKISKLIINTSVLFVIICILFSVLISTNITKGFRKLMKVMEVIQKGNLKVRVNSQRRDELGVLSNGFDNMIIRIDELINKNYEQKLRENKARLKVLQAQISPHFLYNTLDSINWMLLDKNEMEISSVVVALADLLRYSISGSQDVVSIKQEIDHIESYLIIQKVRFEDRFTYSIDVSEDILEKNIPRLLIQPIVENAIVHGIEGRMRGNILCIRGYQTDFSVNMEV